jgi:hypothetical protein
MPKKNDLEHVAQSQNDRRAELANWRAGRMHELTLPSGLKVMVADVTITDLIFTGKLPPSILALGEEAARNGRQELDLNAISQNAAEFGQLMDALMKIAIKDPPIADHGDDEHLGLDELPGDDKMAVFNWINRETAAVQPFRDERQPAQAGRAGKTVLDEAELDPESAYRLDRLAN